MVTGKNPELNTRRYGCQILEKATHSEQGVELLTPGMHDKK